MANFQADIRGLVTTKDSGPKVADFDKNVLIVLEDCLSCDAIIEIAKYVNDAGYSAQFATEEELPILAEFPNRAYGQFVQAGLVAGKSQREDQKTCSGALLLKSLQQFLGPIDQQIIHSPDIVNDSWLQRKHESLSRLLIDLGDSDAVVLKGNSLLDQAQSLKARALEFLRQADLGSLREVTFETRNAAGAQLPADQRFSYTEQLSQLLGDDLVAVIGYGGSVTAPSLDKINDFDNFVVVKDLTGAYNTLRANKLFHCHKPVHSQLIPHDLLGRYLLMSYAGPDALKVIHGEAEIPVLNQSQEIYMMMTDVTTSVFNKRRSLLSTFIAKPDEFISKVKENPGSLALVAAHTVIPLAQIGWFRRFVSNPSEPKIGKRDAAKEALKNCDLPPIPEAFLDAGAFLSSSPADIQIMLAESINSTSKALVAVYNWLKKREEGLDSVSFRSR